MFHDLKSFIRFYGGEMICQSRLKEIARSFYIYTAKNHVKKFESALSASWIRRSTVTEDFFPLRSDIDLTLVIKDDALKEFMLTNRSTPLLIQDIQYVSERFFDCWIETAGLRNRQAKQWMPLGSSLHPLTPPQENHREILAFELAHEIHLLYKQLIEKLKNQLLLPTEVNIYPVKKLIKELERLRLFWISGDIKLLLEPRNSIPDPLSLESWFKDFDKFCIELLANLRPPLNQIKLDPLIEFHDDRSCSWLNLEVDRKKVIVTHSSHEVPNLLRLNLDHFIAPNSFIILIKGVGVQEQPLLNSLAKSSGGYYLKFNIQRLAHDLIGAIINDPSNHTQLYYCFRNIRDFLSDLDQEEPSFWKEISYSWTQRGELPYERGQLVDVSLAHLDLLSALL